MKALVNNGYLSVRMTDEEAVHLITELRAVLARRAELIAAEPSMATWDDNALTVQGTLGEQNVQISFSVCGV